MDGRAFNPSHALGRRDVLRALAACLADLWLPRRVFAQQTPRFKKPDHRVIVVTFGGGVRFEDTLNAEKGLAYRNRTLYLFLAEGVDELLAIRPDVPGKGERAPQSATLADVCATMAQWLGSPLPDFPGRPIAALVG